MHTTFPLLPTLASLRRTERTTSASTPGIGFPWGQVEGFFRALIKPSSTSAEMACSNRQASSWSRDHENSNRSVSKRSERRCLLINSFFFLMIRPPPRSTPLYSSAASDVYKRQGECHPPHAPRLRSLQALPRARFPRATTRSESERAGVPGVTGVWAHEAGSGPAHPAVGWEENRRGQGHSGNRPLQRLQPVPSGSNSRSNRSTLRKVPQAVRYPVSYTHLTLPTN